MSALPSSLISSLSCAPALSVVETAGGLPEALAGLPDPRARRGVRHRLTVVVTAAVFRDSTASNLPSRAVAQRRDCRGGAQLAVQDVPGA